MIPQLFPVLVMKFTSNLQWVLWAFSVSYILLYTFIFSVLKWVLNQPNVAVGLIVALLLGVEFSFYHPVTETHQAIAWSVLFYGCLVSEKDKLMVKVLAVLSFFLALFAHPTAVFMLSFALAWHYAESNKLKSLTPYVLIFLLLCYSFLRSKFNEGNYDAEQYKNSYDAIRNISAFFSWSSVLFVKYRLALYGWPILFLLYAIVYFTLKKKYAQLVLVLVAPVCFFILAATTFYQGDSQMMMEKAYLPAFTMISIAITPILRDHLFSASVLFVCLLLFYTVSIININMVGNRIFKPRLLAIDKIIDDCIASQQFKVIGWKDSASAVLRQYWWATSADVLVRSRAKTGKSVTLYMATSANDFEVAKRTNVFMYTDWCISTKMSALNPKYFSLPNLPYYQINLSKYE